jgi:DNA (cytosine-5)-methyltransferase 1
MAPQFILSLFPGLDLLGRAFAWHGHTVVRGPDLVTGDRIEDFHGLAGHVDGIIAGPPCQDFSCLRRKPPSGQGRKMLLELLRVAEECTPTWILVENVPRVPSLRRQGHTFQRLDLTDLECGGRQLRRRHWQWWHQLGHTLRVDRAVTPPRRHARAVTASPGRSQPNGYAAKCRAMGLPQPIKPAGWTHAALCRAIGNAVTWPMAMKIAAAVSQSIDTPQTGRLCICGCARRAPRFGDQATAACRKRMERRRRHPLDVLEFSPATPPIGGSYSHASPLSYADD